MTGAPVLCKRSPGGERWPGGRKEPLELCRHTGDALLGYLSATTTAPMADLERVHRAPRHIPRFDHWVSTPAVIPGATTAGTRQTGAPRRLITQSGRGA